MPRSKVLILGAGVYQVPLITRCRAMGLEVHVASIRGPYPGFGIADRVHEVDVRDREGLLDIARHERVDAVLTDQTDLPVVTAAWINERMGLQGIGSACAERFSNKRLMHERCREIGVPVPHWQTVRSPNEARGHANTIGLPMVVRPVDSQGSRGVRLVADESTLISAVEEALRFSQSNEVLLEEYFPGREVVIEGIALDDSFVNLAIGDRLYFDLPGLFIPQATLFPARLSEDHRRKLLDLNRRLITGFGLPFGITHSEFIFQPETGSIRLIETAARGGGVFISSDLIPLATGVQVDECLIRRSLGERVTIDSAAVLNRASGYACFSLPQGRVVRAPNAEDVASIKGVHSIHLSNLESGSSIPPMLNKTMRQGPILMHAETRAELDQVHDEVRRTLRVDVMTPTGVEGPIWQ